MKLKRRKKHRKKKVEKNRDKQNVSGISEKIQFLTLDEDSSIKQNLLSKDDDDQENQEFYGKFQEMGLTTFKYDELEKDSKKKRKKDEYGTDKLKEILNAKNEPSIEDEFYEYRNRQIIKDNEERRKKKILGNNKKEEWDEEEEEEEDDFEDLSDVDKDELLLKQDFNVKNFLDILEELARKNISHDIHPYKKYLRDIRFAITRIRQNTELFQEFWERVTDNTKQIKIRLSKHLLTYFEEEDDKKSIFKKSIRDKLEKIDRITSFIFYCELEYISSYNDKINNCTTDKYYDRVRKILKERLKVNLQEYSNRELEKTRSFNN